MCSWYMLSTWPLTSQNSHVPHPPIGSISLPVTTGKIDLLLKMVKERRAINLCSCVAFHDLNPFVWGGHILHAKAGYSTLVYSSPCRYVVTLIVATSSQRYHSLQVSTHVLVRYLHSLCETAGNVHSTLTTIEPFKHNSANFLCHYLYQAWMK